MISRHRSASYREAVWRILSMMQVGVGRPSKGFSFFLFCPPPSPAHTPLKVRQQAENDEIYFELVNMKQKKARLCCNVINHCGRAYSMQWRLQAVDQNMIFRACMFCTAVAENLFVVTTSTYLPTQSTVQRNRCFVFRSSYSFSCVQRWETALISCRLSINCTRRRVTSVNSFSRSHYFFRVDFAPNYFHEAWKASTKGLRATIVVSSNERHGVKPQRRFVYSVCLLKFKPQNPWFLSI